LCGADSARESLRRGCLNSPGVSLPIARFYEATVLNCFQQLLSLIRNRAGPLMLAKMLKPDTGELLPDRDLQTEFLEGK
jgi:hypothetical protein